MRQRDQRTSQKSRQALIRGRVSDRGREITLIGDCSAVDLADSRGSGEVMAMPILAAVFLMSYEKRIRIGKILILSKRESILRNHLV